MPDLRLYKPVANTTAPLTCPGGVALAFDPATPALQQLDFGASRSLANATRTLGAFTYQTLSGSCQ